MRKVVSVLFLKDFPVDFRLVKCEGVSYYKWSRQVKELLNEGWTPVVRLRNKHGVYSCKYSPNHHRYFIILEDNNGSSR